MVRTIFKDVERVRLSTILYYRLADQPPRRNRDRGFSLPYNPFGMVVCMRNGFSLRSISKNKNGYRDPSGGFVFREKKVPYTPVSEVVAAFFFSLVASGSIESTMIWIYFISDIH